MKNKIHKYLIALTLLYATSSCDVLNQEPESLIATSDAIVDRQSAESALNGLYNSAQDGDLYGGRFIMATEMLAVNGSAEAFQAFWQELESGNVPASNFHLEDFWISAYASINSANSILSALPELSGIDEDDRNRIIGTSLYFRALMHFDLLRQFGEFFDATSQFGIPVVLQPSLSISETPRSTVFDTYEQIEQDLTQAIDLLEDHGDKFFASQGAAQALMARVALYRRDYSTAAAMASAVIDNGNYALPEDYNEVYLVEGSSESIFELNFITLDDPNSWTTEMYITPPEVAVNSDLIDFLNTNNESERGQLFEFIDGYDRCTKYGRAREDNGTNTIVQRLSEMYLIRAEALALDASGSPDDALADMNIIRTRAGLPDLNSFASNDELISALIRERRAEFAFEGHYWFDIVRLGRMESITGRQSFRRVLPIPQRELNITDDVLSQNPGY